MFVFVIIVILMLAQITAYKNDRKLADTLGIMCCGFILVLYVLAFFSVLSWIDYICIPVVIVVPFWIWRNGLGKKFFVELFSIQNICIFLAIGLLILCQWNRVAVWTEDIAFWAADLKTLWFKDGFTGKYANVSPEFGYYPPAIQLFKWFFLHMVKGEYTEGMSFAGYMCLNFVLALPLVSRIDKFIDIKETIIQEEEENVGVKLAKNKKYYVSDKKLISKYKVNVSGNNSEILGERIVPLHCWVLFIANAIACICLIVLPSIASSLGYIGSCADVTLGILFGVMLLSILDKDREHATFYFVRIALLGCVMILCKPSGVLYGLIAIAFMIVTLLLDRKGERYNQASLFETNVRHGIIAVSSWGVIGISWIIYVLICGRVVSSYVDGSSVFAAKELNIGYFISSNIWEFMKVLVIRPINLSLIGLPVIGYFVLFMIILAMMKTHDVISESMGNVLRRFVIVSFVVCYLAVLVNYCINLSSGEMYSDDRLLEFVSQHGIPWILGMAILMIGVFFTSLDYVDVTRPVADSYVRERITTDNFKIIRRTYLIAFVAVILLCNHTAYINGLWGYNESLMEDVKMRSDVLDDKEKAFVESVADNQELWGKRVLYLKDASDVRWDHNPYITYESVPIAVVYGSVSSETSEEDWFNLLTSSHAKYLYIEDIDGVGERLGYVQEWEHVDEQGQVNLFRVLDEGKIEPYRITIDQ